MEKRKLGKSGLEIAPLALGGNVFGWTIEEQMSFMSFKIMDAFLAAGFNFIDTALTIKKAPLCFHQSKGMS
jgi:aryl-alcohol dehydrogenase-like predicted oxidoreductase